jgi:hypothetical protein
MHSLSMPGMAIALWATGQTKALRRCLFAPVVAVQHWLRAARVVQQENKMAPADAHYLRQTPSFVMLVESDVKEGVVGLLP